MCAAATRVRASHVDVVRHAFYSLATALLLSTCTGQIPPAQVSPAAGAFRFVAHAQPANVPLSSGDLVRGRQAFLDLKCNSCHRVAEDPSLPAAKDALDGPVLRNLGQYSPEAVAWKIIMQTSMDPEAVYDSPMEEPASIMTERQLADIVAYLRDPAAARNR
jgi:mono/diheme cytochrome c family protein